MSSSCLCFPPCIQKLFGHRWQSYGFPSNSAYIQRKTSNVTPHLKTPNPASTYKCQAPLKWFTAPFVQFRKPEDTFTVCYKILGDQIRYYLKFGPKGNRIARKRAHNYKNPATVHTHAEMLLGRKTIEILTTNQGFIAGFITIVPDDP